MQQFRSQERILNKHWGGKEENQNNIVEQRRKIGQYQGTKRENRSYVKVPRRKTRHIMRSHGGTQGYIGKFLVLYWWPCMARRAGPDYEGNIAFFPILPFSMAIFSGGYSQGQQQSGCKRGGGRTWINEFTIRVWNCFNKTYQFYSVVEFTNILLIGTVSRDNLYSIFFIDHIILNLLEILFEDFKFWQIFTVLLNQKGNCRCTVGYTGESGLVGVAYAGGVGLTGVANTGYSTKKIFLTQTHRCRLQRGVWTHRCRIHWWVQTPWWANTGESIKVQPSKPANALKGTIP